MTMPDTALQNVPLGGGVSDALTVVIGFLAAGIKMALRWWLNKPPIFEVGKCTVDLLNGSVIFPFAAMFVPLLTALFSWPYLDKFGSASPASVALAGGVGLFFLIGELRKLD